MAESLSEHVSGSVEAADNFNYGENSLARRLIPHSLIEFVIFGIIRSLVYLVPHSNPLNGIVAAIFNSYYMSSPVTWLSSLIIMFSIPSLWRALRGLKKQEQFTKIVFIAFVAFFLTVGALNTTFIQERYRIVYDYLLLTLWLLMKQQVSLQKRRR